MDLKEPIFSLVVMEVAILFQIPTPVFLINELAIKDLVKGTLRLLADLVGYEWMWLLVMKKDLNISGKREFLNLNKKIAADLVYISGRRTEYRVCFAEEFRRTSSRDVSNETNC